MSQAQKQSTLSTGFAMFSMFFGAGNVVFPLAVGQYAQSQTLWAMAGLVFTGVLIPFLGLMAMTLYDGNHHHFFQRIGKNPGFVAAILIMVLIGPFGATPRTITLSYSTIKMYLPGLSLPAFSLAASLVIYFFTYKKRKILDLLGLVLTPILLVTLGIIIAVGLFTPSSLTSSSLSSSQAFFHGLTEGYNTMDLMGAFFFSSVVLSCLKADLPKDSTPKQLVTTTLQSSLIGAGLLAAVYTGFALVASFHSPHLEGIPLDELIGKLAISLLGPYAGILASAAVALACLTTAIALAAVFAEFLQKDICKEKISFPNALLLTLAVNFAMCLLSFEGILKILVPLLQILYPAMIMLSVVNLAHKLWGFSWVKAPVAATLFLTLLAKAWI